MIAARRPARLRSTLLERYTPSAPEPAPPPIRPLRVRQHRCQRGVDSSEGMIQLYPVAARRETDPGNLLAIILTKDNGYVLSCPGPELQLVRALFISNRSESATFDHGSRNRILRTSAILAYCRLCDHTVDCQCMRCLAKDIRFRQPAPKIRNEEDRKEKKAQQKNRERNREPDPPTSGSGVISSKGEPCFELKPLPVCPSVGHLGSILVQPPRNPCSGNLWLAASARQTRSSFGLFLVAQRSNPSHPNPRIA